MALKLIFQFGCLKSNLSFIQSLILQLPSDLLNDFL